ncbi:MAG: DUF2304 domain-containing protein [Chitinophagaceae bacterium]|nr:DUF2304 domain-containing protein [Chitinophagaceae bacterium]
MNEWYKIIINYKCAIYCYLLLFAFKKSLFDLILLLLLFGAAVVLFFFQSLPISWHINLASAGGPIWFYLSIIFFWFVILKLYSKIRKLEQTHTEIIRKEAIREAEKKANHTKQWLSPA